VERPLRPAYGKGQAGSESHVEDTNSTGAATIDLKYGFARDRLHQYDAALADPPGRSGSPNPPRLPDCSGSSNAT